MCIDHHIIIYQTNTNNSIHTQLNCNSPLLLQLQRFCYTEISYKFVPKEASEEVDTRISYQLSNHAFTIGGINNGYKLPLPPNQLQQTNKHPQTTMPLVYLGKLNKSRIGDTTTSLLKQ